MTEYPKEFLRYERQLILPQVGEDGQRKLLSAKVLVVGTGGLGSPVLYYLAAAGVGTLGLVDSDTVEITNLNRQIIHWEKDLSRPKVISAREKLEAFNSQLKINTYQMLFDPHTAREIIPQYDLVIAAVDNLETRRVINEVCFALEKPWIEGGVKDFAGLITTFRPPQGPCYQCLYPDVNLREKRPIGLMGVMPGVIGVLQAQEAIKLILGIGTPLAGRLLIFDALETRFETITLARNPQCPICSH
ncbi:molybdopterin-synthase adenylyltransferase MoeB [Thermanaerosceptrum fracticalcis]|uniref:Molybdopterin-synthase adenylyltransferase MoeB n=1 Tax=Thermanaerosceptrum fracticalcis TaxID=1712410 RepID=A0A7G6E2B8_THEFR|nr:HesA/MoeB/ThiF family protein [Thermanaerosceptrum fracticalcis]QNB46222.1 molybdopterin-synthase adenylyltransferase MoeB [Thermanaerosceptrum fracticalcis]